MMNRELSSHCLCDKCSGDDCQEVEPIDPDKIRKDEREKVLDKLCKICPFLDERPETCENCVVETTRKELRKQENP
jgi:hypothetical protein